MTAPRPSNNASKFILVLGTLASIIIVGGVLYQAQNDSLVDQEILAIPEQTAVTATDEAMVPEASIPDSVSAVTGITEVAQSKPTLPSLDDSDPFVRTRVSLMSNKENLQGWLATDDLLRRTASYLDGLARGVILTKIFPLSPPQGKFTTHRDGNVIWLNAGNYERYNSTILILTFNRYEADGPNVPFFSTADRASLLRTRLSTSANGWHYLNCLRTNSISTNYR